jgi:hypothetical protein
VIVIVTISESFHIIICYKSKLILELLFLVCLYFVVCFAPFPWFLSVLNFFVSHPLDIIIIIIIILALFISYCEFL